MRVHIYVLSIIFFCVSNIALSYAEEEWNCVEYGDQCIKKLNDSCQEYMYNTCLKYERVVSRYSAGCDLSNIMSMINQEHCELVVTCNDPIDVVGECYRGSGCYPGYYYDDCPAGYDVRYTGDIEQKDCSLYGQTGTITLEKYEYGNFVGGSAMSLTGGGVTCQKYYSSRKLQSCADRLENGERPPECYVNECANLENNPRCQRVDDLGTTEYGLETSELAGFENGRLYDVKIEKYQCDSADIRNCKNKEYKMVCPDGSQTLCQSEKTCLEWTKEIVTKKVEREYILNRNYTSKTCIVENGECVQYDNNPDCVVVSSSISYEDSIMPCGKPTTLNGKQWCQEGSYSIVGGNNNITNKDFIDSANCAKNGLEFLWTFTRTDGEAHTAFGWNITSNKVNATGSIDTWSTNNVTVYQTNKINNGVCGQKWNMALNNVRDPGSASFRSGRIDFWSPYVLKTKRTYYCYTNYNTLNVPSECQSQNNDLCLDYQTDLLNSNKAVCRKSVFNYLCDEESISNVCANYDEKLVCNNQSFPIPNVEMKNDNFTDFGNALGILGMLDDINSIWSGEYNYCSYGYFVNGFGGVYCNNCRGSGGFMCFQKKPEQQKAYEMNEKGLCHYLTTDCTNRIKLGFGSICIEKTKKYCCYDSKLARVIVEQAYSQLGKSWSIGCNGLTTDDLNRLDFSAMDFSEIEQDLQSKIEARSNQIDDVLKDRIRDYYTDFSNEMEQRGTHPQSK